MVFFIKEQIRTQPVFPHPALRARTWHPIGTERLFIVWGRRRRSDRQRQRLEKSDRDQATARAKFFKIFYKLGHNRKKEVL
jgi:hypothetical protein